MGSFFSAIHFQSLIPYPLSLSENLMYETFIQTNACNGNVSKTYLSISSIKLGKEIKDYVKLTSILGTKLYKSNISFRFLFYQLTPFKKSIMSCTNSKLDKVRYLPTFTPKSTFEIFISLIMLFNLLVIMKNNRGEKKNPFLNHL
jgi:hypothetical protein